MASNPVLKSQIYYLFRRQLYQQTVQCCEAVMSKKGKDPIALYWHAFANGMLGNIQDCLRDLESFQSRKDLQFPVNAALLFFHKKASAVDREAVSMLRSEISVSEDVAKETALILAARFYLFARDFSEAKRIAKKVTDLNRGSNTTTIYEVEAYLIEQWCNLEELSLDWSNSAEQKRVLSAIDNTFRNNKSPDFQDPDALMLWVRVKYLLGLENDCFAVLNQIISLFPSFVPAMCDKALLLASMNDWEQALDAAQRVIDSERDNLDALLVIAVHAFTQESQPHDAVEKLEQLDRAIQEKEPASVELALETATLFCVICNRQPRALQYCGRLLERVLKVSRVLNNETEARIYSELGRIYLMQGVASFDKAMKAFREGTKKDANNMKVLMGLVLCQLCEGAYEDAESQMELLSMMQGGGSSEEVGYEMLYLQSIIFKHNKKSQKKEHLQLLLRCFQSFLAARDNASVSSLTEQSFFFQPARPRYLRNFQTLLDSNPDFSILLALEFFEHVESTASSSTLIPSTNSLLSSNASEEEEEVETAAGKSSLLDDDMLQSAENSSGSTAASHCRQLLQAVINSCPGMMVAYVEIARVHVAHGKFEEAARVLQQCLALQPQASSVLIALAFVETARFRTPQANRLLEQALAADFSIRNVPKFQLVKAIVRAQQGKFSEALAELELLMTAPDFGYLVAVSTGALGGLSGGGGGKGGAANQTVSYQVAPASQHHQPSAALTSYSDPMRLTDDDRVCAYVSYASLLSRERRMKEANKVLQHAKVLFAGSSQEVQVLIAASQLYVEKGDFDAAIRMLEKVSPDSPSFSKAQIAKAEIVLRHNHDKEGFTKCFVALVERDPSVNHLILLGDAFLKILNPDSAIDALERAYKLDPANTRLRAKIGRALVATHEYHRAVEFYESALREASRSGPSAATNSDTLQLSHDLAKLYLKLGRLESASRVLSHALIDNPSDVLAMKQNVSTLLLIASVQQMLTPEEILDSLSRALQLQKEVLLKTRSHTASASSDQVEEEKLRLSEICEKLGAFHFREEQIAEAEGAFQQAIQYNPQNIAAMVGLARVYQQKKEFEACLNQAMKVITGAPGDRDAAVLASEVLMNQEQSQRACEVLSNYMALKPNDYVALEKTINLLRRAGELKTAQQFLAGAEKADRRCAAHPGYHYCLGLYARFTNDIGKAISEFNFARRDDYWGAAALTHMVELYLNPDQEGVWEEKETGPVDDLTRENIAAAEKLLEELKPIAKDQRRVRILESYCGLATRNKVAVERAMQTFSDILDSDQDYLPAVLGMATGFMIEKNQHKARNLLKRVGKMEMSKHDGEDFEKANLLLAKFYIDKSKHDLAQETCRKTLLQNKSCSQAWEILGLIYEKDGDYQLASDAYEKAWQLEFEMSATVGFKLAFSYLKCGKFVECVDVCETVLKQYPEYPRIGEEILFKALQSIRTNNPVH